jgi:hypothetical protein
MATATGSSKCKDSLDRGAFFDVSANHVRIHARQPNILQKLVQLAWRLREVLVCDRENLRDRLAFTQDANI